MNPDEIMVTLQNIDFSADRSGSFAATWGQRRVWDELRRYDPVDSWSFRPVIALADSIDRPLDFEETLDALRMLIERHTALRTRFQLDPVHGGLVQQIIEATGTVPVCVIKGEGADRIEDHIRAIAADPDVQRFDPATDWPMKIFVGGNDSTALTVGIVLSHIVIDGGGFQALLRDFRLILSGEGALETIVLDPIAVALAEQQDKALKKTLDAVSHLQPALLAASRNALLAPRYPIVVPRAHEALLASDALESAQSFLARTLGLFTQGAVALTAASVALGHLVDVDYAVFQVICSNRWNKRSLSYVGQLSQSTYIRVGSARDDILNEIARVDRALLSGARHASYDPAAVWDILESSAADVSLHFNDTRYNRPSPLTDDYAFTRDLKRGSVEWIETEPLGAGRDQMKLLVRLRYYQNRFVLAIRSDSSFIAAEEIPILLHDIEDAIVSLARSVFNGPDGF